MHNHSRIYIAGHRGLVGSAICRVLERRGYNAVSLRNRSELDLRDWCATEAYFQEERPEYVFLAAARVGGILANDSYPAEFLRDNLQIQHNVIEMSRRIGVKRLLFLGSSCIYPRMAPQPISEDCLLTGPLEPTNRAYAIAKIAGIEMCWSYNRQYGTQYVAAMPANLYGPGDNFDLNNSHVLPALIRKIDEAKLSGGHNVLVWGTGNPRREFLYSEDLAEACILIMTLPDQAYGSLLSRNAPPLINIGTGEDLTIHDLAALTCKVLGFDGELVFDPNRPDGTLRKLLDVRRIHALGWRAKTSMEDGIRLTYESYKLQTEHSAASSEAPKTLAS